MSAVIRPDFQSAKPSSKRKSKMVPGTWFIGPAQAMGDSRLRGRHWRVLSALCFHADHDGYCWPSQETISDITTLSRNTVGRAIKELIDFGYVKRGKKQMRKSGRYQGNTYTVIRRKLPNQSADRATPVSDMDHDTP